MTLDPCLHLSLVTCTQEGAKAHLEGLVGGPVSRCVRGAQSGRSTRAFSSAGSVLYRCPQDPVQAWLQALSVCLDAERGEKGRGIRLPRVRECAGTKALRGHVRLWTRCCMQWELTAASAHTEQS